MATITFPNAPANLKISDFRAINDMYGGPLKTSRFAVVIKPQGSLVSSYATFTNQLLYLCEVAEMPGRGFVAIDGIRYYGPAFKLPSYTEYDDINLTFICRTASLERQFFDDWLTIINPINTFDFNYRDDYRSEIDIYQFGDFAASAGATGPEAQYCITLIDAWPYMVSPQPVAWADDQFQRVVVSFTYMKWIRKGIDPEARGGEPPNFSFNLVQGRNVTR